MPGNMKDFATGVVLTAPSPATSGTSVVLQSGEGDRFPAAPFYVVAHPPSDMPNLDNAEKLYVTAKSTDTLTIVRAQGDTTAKSILVGWRISNTLFKEQLDDKEARVSPLAVSSTTAAATAAKVATTSGGAYVPATGDIIAVTFTNANTATSPTINIDGSGAKNILLGNVNPTAVAMAGTKVIMWYDGTAFQLFGSQRVSDTDTNTTYIEATAFTTVSGTTQAAAVNNGYIANNAAEVNVTLPATAAIGQIVHVLGLGAGGWRVTAPSGDNIRIDGNDTGAAGYISGGQYATVGLRCIVANTTWEVIDYTGTLATGAGYSTAKQPLDATLTALAGLATGANKIPYSTGTDTFGQLDLSTNTSLGTSDTTLATQKAVKAYVDADRPSANSTALFTDQGTSSTSYVDLTTVVSTTVTVGQSGVLLVGWIVGAYNTSGQAKSSVALSGANTVAASDDWATDTRNVAYLYGQTGFKIFTGLTPGSTTVTMKFKTSSGTANFFNKSLSATSI